jgi:hypothetical protein
MTCPHSEAEHQKKVNEALAQQEQQFAAAGVESNHPSGLPLADVVSQKRGCSSGQCR